MLRFQRIPVNINFWFAGLRWPRAGRGPPGDASVCRPDGPAVRTPGGPGPDEGGLGQRLRGAAGGPGAAGARGFLGAPRVGAELKLTFVSGGASPQTHLTMVSSRPPRCTSECPRNPWRTTSLVRGAAAGRGLEVRFGCFWLNSPEGSFAQMMVGSVLPVYRNSECIPIFHCCS